MLDYDAIGAGLGAGGSASLYQLARAGVCVLGLDRFSPPHEYGSSHGDSRITRLAIGEEEHLTPFAQRSQELWRQIEQDSGQSLLTRCGALMISSDGSWAPVHGTSFLRPRSGLPADAALRTQCLMQRQFGASFRSFSCAIMSMAIMNLRPASYAPRPASVRSCHWPERLGARVHMAERLCGFERDGAHVRVITELQSYRARRLILAVGAWMPNLLGATFASPGRF